MPKGDMGSQTMCYTLSMVLCTLFSLVVSQQLAYNFEADSVPNEITPQSSVLLSTNRFKDGSKSLKWQWTAGQRLTWDLSSKAAKIGENGGIKFWVYNTKRLFGQCLSICIRKESSQSVSCFPFALNFVGWRAVWVAYKEFVGCPLPTSALSVRQAEKYLGKIDQFFIIAPSGATSENTLQIDLLRFVKRISETTRDLAIPPITYVQSEQIYCTSCSKMYSGLSEPDALSLYGRSSHWQQIYRWNLRPSPAVPLEVDTTKLTALKEITQRLVNWYANENTVFTRIPRKVSAIDSFLMHRWDSLLDNIDSAHSNFHKLTTSRNILASGLFGKSSRLDKPNDYKGPKTFSFVFSEVLLPLALEHHIKSRCAEVQKTACLLAKKYACSSCIGLESNDVEAITGKDSYLQKYFTSLYCRSTTIASTESGIHPSCPGATQICFNQIQSAINDFSNYRKTRIFQLFSYIKDQGWDKGSALGSMDHEVVEMFGFAHSVFLMREELKSTGKLSDIIDTMKWYTEFGELYQTPFEFKGSTADRVRTVMLYRLITVLAMPEDDDNQRKEKIRDMDALKMWIVNALSINEGLGGLIKPDYTCYHDGTFYGAANCPSALHTAALISYMLEGTAYQLSKKTKLNLINALKVFRITAVRYSTPSQINGQMPKYDNAIFAEHVPAFAYMAMKPGQTKVNIFTPLNEDLAQVRMFLRLYDHVSGTCTGRLNKHLCDGKVSQTDYFNTLGSLQIMDQVKSIASKVTIGPLQWFYHAEQSQNGHWTKQFGALSIHRRDDWVVSIKGFDKYVWDYENALGHNGNYYGMYSSHGAMLIANSEQALSSKKVDQGWDWRKIPGTTVISVNFPDMLIKSDRHYNPSEDAMAGGVFFQGSKSTKEGNGVFGMNFQQPQYDVEPDSPFYKINFRFKKSVHFYDDIIVSLGSNIHYSGGQYEVHTTLFQDLMLETNPSSSGQQVSHIFHCNDGTSLKQTTWSNMALVILVDVNGNRYYVRNPDQQGLVFWRNQRQESVASKAGKDTKSCGIYCTAWLNHGKNPLASSTKKKYEYAVQVDAEPVGRQQKPYLDPQNRYQVIKQGRKVHVVKFNQHNNRGTVYGYVVFPISPKAPVKVGRKGPIEFVYNQSVIMVEETTQPARLYISVNSPQLNFRKKEGSPPWCNGGTMSPTRFSEVDETLLYCSKSTSHDVHVDLRNNNKWSALRSLKVGGSDKTIRASDHIIPRGAPTQNPLKFINLKNGADTEVCYQ